MDCDGVRWIARGVTSGLRTQKTPPAPVSRNEGRGVAGRLLTGHPDRIVGDPETGCDNTGSSADEATDVGMPEGHQPQAEHGGEQGEDIDHGPGLVAEDRGVPGLP